MSTHEIKLGKNCMCQVNIGNFFYLFFIDTPYSILMITQISLNSHISCLLSLSHVFPSHLIRRITT